MFRPATANFKAFSLMNGRANDIDPIRYFKPILAGKRLAVQNF